MASEAIRYEGWICSKCGCKWQQDSSRIATVSTFHINTCGVCGKRVAVTEARDFGYPLIPAQEVANGK